jgi:hypothetical protein
LLSFVHRLKLMLLCMHECTSVKNTGDNVASSSRDIWGRFLFIQHSWDKGIGLLYLEYIYFPNTFFCDFMYLIGLGIHLLQCESWQSKFISLSCHQVCNLTDLNLI